nr:MAG TPA: hypothetical protein [Caudoviricetes sp.]
MGLCFKLREVYRELLGENILKKSCRNICIIRIFVLSLYC